MCRPFWTQKMSNFMWCLVSWLQKLSVTKRIWKWQSEVVWSWIRLCSIHTSFHPILYSFKVKYIQYLCFLSLNPIMTAILNYPIITILPSWLFLPFNSKQSQLHLTVCTSTYHSFINVVYFVCQLLLQSERKIQTIYCLFPTVSDRKLCAFLTIPKKGKTCGKYYVRICQFSLSFHDFYQNKKLYSTATCRWYPLFPFISTYIGL